MDVFTFALIVWMIKVIAEDTWSTCTGKPNQRVERRRARQKHRAGNPVWEQFVGWLGDLATEARQDRVEARQRKRERRARDRGEPIDAEVIEDAELVDDWPAGYNPDPGVVDMGTPPARQSEEERHENLSNTECTYDICPVHGKGAKPAPGPSTTTPLSGTDKGAADMSEIQGLDNAIDYAHAVAAMAQQHSTAGNEGYIGTLTASNVTGEALASAYEMQSAMSAAMAAAEHHEQELTKQRAVQEQYDINPDAGDQQFQQSGR